MLVRALALVLIGLLLCGLSQAAEPAPPELQLSPLQGDHDAWPSVSVLADAQGELSLGEVLARSSDFEPAGARAANLGRRQGAVWLRVPLRVEPGLAGRWVLDVDYPPLDDIQVFLLDPQGRVHQQARLGDALPWSERPMRTRSHAVALELAPDTRWLLLVRVESAGSMLAPMRVMTHEQFEASESREQALQGLMAGASLMLLIYSLAQWVALRDAVFGLYALTLLGSTGFFASLSGFGALHLWSGSDWLLRNAPPFTILLSVCGAFLFAERALDVRTLSPRTALIVRGCGIAAGLSALAFLVGLIDYGLAQAIGMGFGPLALVLLLPTAVRRLRMGDPAARYLMIGWGFYLAGVMVMVSLLAGLLPVGFWSLRGFQFASLVEMASWMMVLAVRVQSVRRRAFAIEAEHERMRTLANTDALTGLLNRRGLQDAAQALLDDAQPQRLVAVFLIDLDGFKPVNDRYGHDAGDALLVAVARRLRAQLREGDLACRLGGDEFVLVTAGLGSVEQAQALGQRLLKASEAPFSIPGGECRVGMTVGYALAPHDEKTLPALLRRADAAMYAGKQAGKQQVRRGLAGPGLGASQEPAELAEAAMS